MTFFVKYRALPQSCAWLLTATFCFLGASFSAAGDEWEWRSFDRTDGLVSDIVTAVAEEEPERLWVGTQLGLCRFDGLNWERVSPLEGRVTALLSAADRSLYAATENGVTRLSGDRWSTIATKGQLHDGIVSEFAQSQDRELWLASTSGLWKSDGVSLTPAPFSRALPSSRVNCVLENNGIVWVGTDKGLARVENSRVSVFKRQHGLPNDDISALALSGDGSLWVGTLDGLAQFDGKSWHKFGLDEGLSDAVITSLLTTRSGDLLAGTLKGGLNTRKENGWARYDVTTSGLSSNRVIVLFESGDGSIWIGGDRGLSHMAQPRWKTVSVAQGLPSPRVSAVYGEDGGVVWFGTDKGLVRIDGASSKIFTVADGLGSNTITDILRARNGSLWVTTFHGVSRFDGNRWLNYSLAEGLPNNMVLDVEEAENGTLWFATQGGVASYDGSRWRVFNTIGNLASDAVRAVSTGPGGEVWVATMGGASCIRSNSIGNFSQADGLVSNDVRSVLATPQAVWFGTNRGVSCYSGGRWTSYRVVDGLVNEGVNRIASDAKGVFWFATDGGVSRFDGREWSNFTSRDGLAVDTTLTASLVSPTEIWFGTTGGATRHILDTQPPETIILGQETDPSGVSRVRFSAADPWKFTDSKSLLFSWRLDGGEWSPFDRINFWVVPRLKGGVHDFEVRSMDTDLNMDRTPARYTVKVPLAFWQEPWFLAAIAAGLACVFFSVAYGLAQHQKLVNGNRTLDRTTRDLATALRELNTANERLRELDKLKSDFVSSVSHELRTPLTAILGFADNMLDGISGELSAKQRDYMNRVKSSAQRLSRLISDLLDLARIEAGRIELSLSEFPVSSVVREVVESVEPLAASKGLRLSSTGVDSTVRVRADRDKISQVLTNLLSNAIKFTQENGSVEVSLQNDGNGKVYVTVKDTGRGLPKEQLDKVFQKFYQFSLDASRKETGTGLGLAISKGLVELHGGGIEVTSEEGVGSAFSFWLPACDEQQV